MNTIKDIKLNIKLIRGQMEFECELCANSVASKLILEQNIQIVQEE